MYHKGQRLEAKYNGRVITLDAVDPDGGIRVTDSEGLVGITTASMLDRLYRPMRGER
jgi:hypothetical protein